MVFGKAGGEDAAAAGGDARGERLAGARKYADHGEELRALIRCGAIEFSATKGRVKAG